MKNKKINNLYTDNYFKKRLLNDQKRLHSFNNENDFISKFISKKEIVLDIGCSTGEFLSHINWLGKKYGMEINNSAIKLAKKSGINFNKNIFNQRNYFEVIIFRGVIQHLEEPFKYIENSYYSLKKNGYLIFLATPDIGSIYYRIFQNLPALDKTKNFYLPSKNNLISVCQIYDFKFIDYSSYYLGSGYEDIIKDYSNFILKIFKLSKKENPFPGNMMNLIFKK